MSVLKGKVYSHSFEAKYRNRHGMTPVLRDAIDRAVAGCSPWPLYIWGEPGAGKTCAGLVIIDELGGAFTTAEEFSAKFRQVVLGEARYASAGQGGKVTEPMFWRRVASLHFMIVDEVGERQPSDFRASTIKRLLDAREGVPTIWISNLSPTGIESMYDSRVASRLQAGTVVECHGDRRKKDC